ncbi:MAG: hypothetical protein JNJ65_02805 [Cyclobacteriaceae bacterium]|nr:hypothetical protein [Cyclobacteriaceae bacterium]
MIHDIWHIGQAVRKAVTELHQRNTIDRFRLANLLEHLGHVLLHTHDQLNAGLDPHPEDRIQLLSEEVYFKLAVLVTETPAMAHDHLLRMGQGPLRLTTDPHALHLLREAAHDFIESSKELRGS